MRGKPYLILKDQSTGRVGSTRQELNVCVQETRKDKKGAANWAPTQSESPGSLESQAENCLEL